MKTVTVDKARVHAKSKLTDLQYYGGLGLTTADHIRISEVLIEAFGAYAVGICVPMTATGQWGFQQWAGVITHGRWRQT